MKLKKAAAWTVVGALVPVMVDVAADPYADRGVAESWVRGAGVVGLVALLSWAFDVAAGRPAEVPEEA